MSFGESIRSCLSQYIGFKGRARRSEFWFFYLFQIIINVMLNGLLLVGANTTVLVIVAVVILFFIPPACAVLVRRLHDTGRSGWWWLIAIIPLIGPVMLIIWWCTDSEPGTNQYGPNPKEHNVTDEVHDSAISEDAKRPDAKRFQTRYLLIPIAAVFVVAAFLFLFSRIIFSRPKPENRGALEKIFGASDELLYRVDAVAVNYERVQGHFLAIIAAGTQEEVHDYIEEASIDLSEIDIDSRYILYDAFPENEDVKRLANLFEDSRSAFSEFVEKVSNGASSEELFQTYQDELAPVFEEIHSATESVYTSLCAGNSYENSTMHIKGSLQTYLMSMRKHILYACAADEPSSIQEHFDAATEEIREFDFVIEELSSSSSKSQDKDVVRRLEELSTAIHTGGNQFLDAALTDGQQGTALFETYKATIGLDILDAEDYLKGLT